MAGVAVESEVLLDSVPWELKFVKLQTDIPEHTVEIMALCYNGFACHDTKIIQHGNEQVTKTWSVSHINSGVKCSPDKPDMQFKTEDQACLFLYKISQFLDFGDRLDFEELKPIWKANKSKILEAYYSTLEEMPAPAESEG